jgi:hypothetical protein
MIQWNYWHYVLLEKPALGGRTLVGRVARPFTALARAWRGRVWHHAYRGRHDQEVSMEVDTATQEAMGKVVMAQMQQHTLQSIRQALRQELLEEARAEAFEAALAEVDDRLQREREKLRDASATEHKALARELEDELDRRSDGLRREAYEHYEQRLDTLKADLHAAAAARDQATELLLSLVTQLVVERPKRYLADACITELDLVGLNAVLAATGQRIRGEFRHSERQVTCLLKDGARQLTAFWIERTPGAGVVDEADSVGEGPDVMHPIER